ncbi:WcbI family polysaccharide biosynthesis putative acetyltransferase [Methylobacterium sp. Leaf118]|uniref:WcbI family polysaccharide biosynthesis putative acetyltransferase n=1 Tax=Methylobacterium sp. Leaf118 TaxID=2876562 RepID=UPI001E5C90CC
MAACLRLLLPEATVETIPIEALRRRFGHLDRLARHLNRADHVFAHFFPASFIEGGDVHTLAERVPRLRYFPAILFAGFHPDLIHVGDEASLRLSRLVASPIGYYHSAIALQAFHSGLSVAATLPLYGETAFARLGYDRLWETSVAYLLRTAEDMGFGLERDFALWCRGGAFMHTINHPRLAVLGDIARRLAREAGYRPLDIPVEAYARDGLAAGPIWPVLPPVAERFGVPGSTLFKGDGRGRPARLLDLPDFVAESFALYAWQEPEALTSARTDAWARDEAVRALFAEAGGRPAARSP